MTRPQLLIALLALCLAGASHPAHAGAAIRLTLDGVTDGTNSAFPVIKTVAQGDTVYFTGTLTNNTGLTLTLAGSSGFGNPAFKSDTALALNFNNGTFRTLAPGASYIGPIVFIDTTRTNTGQPTLTPVGAYSEVYDNVNLVDASNNQYQSNPVYYEPLVTPAPEPSPLAALAVGMLGVGILAARRRTPYPALRRP